MGPLTDRQFWGDILRNTRDVGGGLLSATLGAPVDIATMAMRPFGYNVPDRKTVGSSDWFGTLLGADVDSTPYKVATLLPTGADDLMRYAAVASAMMAGTIKQIKAGEKSKGLLSASKTNFERAHEIAQRNAAKPVSEGGLGLPADNTAMDRAKAMGFIPAYHGTTGDVKQFAKNLRGSATGAPSAKKADFAASNPHVAVGYSLLGDGREAARLSREVSAAERSRDFTKAEDLTQQLENVVFGRRNEELKVSDERFAALENFQNVLGKYGVVQDYDVYRPAVGDYKEVSKALNTLKTRQDAYERALKKLPSNVDAKQLWKEMEQTHGGSILWNTSDEYKKIAESLDEKIQRLGDLYRAMHDGRWESMQAFRPQDAALKELNDAYGNIRNYDAQYYALGVPEGANVMPLMVNTSDFKVKDFRGSGYRDESYNDLIKLAAAEGKSGVVMKNTFDPGQRAYNEMTDVFAVRDPALIRSRFAAFDPAKRKEADLLGYATLPTLGLAGLLGLGGLAGLSYFEQR